MAGIVVGANMSPEETAKEQKRTYQEGMANMEKAVAAQKVRAKAEARLNPSKHIKAIGN